METLLLLTLLTRPVHGPITQKTSKIHPAVDFACSVGDPVLAAHTGRLQVRRSATLGNVAVVEGSGFVSLYAHLDTVSPPGEVKQGEPVGTCGNTGRLTTGPHLHLEIQRKDLQQI